MLGWRRRLRGMSKLRQELDKRFANLQSQRRSLCHSARAPRLTSISAVKCDCKEHFLAWNSKRWQARSLSERFSRANVRCWMRVESPLIVSFSWEVRPEFHLFASALASFLGWSLIRRWILIASLRSVLQRRRQFCKERAAMSCCLM